MEPENINQNEVQFEQKSSLHQVTPLSKYLAMALFIILPFVGGYVGYQYAPEKVVEIIKEVEVIREVQNEVSDENLEQPIWEYQPISTTTVDMVSYRIRYTNDAVELLDGPNIVQTIPWDTTFRKTFTDDNSLLITNYDVNFDHYLDLGILKSVGSGGSNRFYDFYTFNPNEYRLEKITDFDTFENDISNAVNPSVNIAERTLTSSFKSGQEYRLIKYQFDGENYVQVEEWSEGW